MAKLKHMFKKTAALFGERGGGRRKEGRAVCTRRLMAEVSEMWRDGLS